MLQQCPTKMKYNEHGNVLFYIFLCVILLGALTMMLSNRGGDEQASGSAAFRNSEEMKSQAQGARSAVMECLLLYNSGYPVQPGSGLLNDVMCDLQTGPQSIFTAQSARAVPVPPAPFDPWTYTNTSSTFIKISTTSAKPASQTVQITLKNLATSFHAPETSTGIFQNQDVCIIANGTKAEFHACIKSDTGICGKVSTTDPCTP